MLFALFVVISVFVVSTVTQASDIAWLRAVGAYRTPQRTSFMQAMSVIGDWRVEVPFALLVAALLRWRGRARDAGNFLFCAITGEALYALLKVSFQRPRPSVIPHLAGAGWYSYPSGHSMLAPIIWGYGLILLATLTRSRPLRVLYRGLGVVIVVAIAASRIYLGVHYPTDVLAGLCIGVAWMLWWRRGVSSPRPLRPDGTAESTEATRHP